ncbi:hypothetical protein J23TS9_20050 [Paenibacillus sp. J23TS9]|uniref:hypothetical protein n=1 Tax=Paenibacillus sp. J23TS9 TaxID=2807193 RepID=UPI001AFFE18A|nr:hypothetical protein [Paenibacillus sp. J23TS9]GIP26875.1 hypothetical protein J23TS9_20050 [Paenibacillus sp. J23TS9]
MNEQLQDMDVFLRTMHILENRINELIRSSDLSEQQKQFILNHILVIPGKDAPLEWKQK